MQWLRALLVALLLFSASFASAKVIWVVGGGAPIDANAVAKDLAWMLNEPIKLVHPKASSLVAWANSPRNEKVRKELFKEASTIILSPSAFDSPALTLMACLSLQEQMAGKGIVPVLVNARKRVYEMKGLRTIEGDITTARIATSAGFRYAPLPKVWERVYTDDFFYDGFYSDGKLEKGAEVENYVQAATLCLTIRGEGANLPPMKGVNGDLAKDLIDSIGAGFAMRDEVIHASARQAIYTFDARRESAFDAVLFDGVFERTIGSWLMRLAASEKRTLRLHYTTDTELNTGWPALFRTTQTLGDMPNACVYTRPAFRNNSGFEEQLHLDAILKRDAHRTGYIPLQIALSTYLRRFPDTPVYDGERPTEPIAAMFASMLWLQWTGSIAFPENAKPEEMQAVHIGVETMLQMRALNKNVNAVLFRPINAQQVCFSLWRAPQDKVELKIEQLDGTATPKTLTFTPKTFWTWQSVSLDGAAAAAQGERVTLVWKTNTPFFGQSAGVRELDLSEPAPSPAEDLPEEASQPAE